MMGLCPTSTMCTFPAAVGIWPAAPGGCEILTLLVLLCSFETCRSPWYLGGTVLTFRLYILILIFFPSRGTTIDMDMDMDNDNDNANAHEHLRRPSAISNDIDIDIDNDNFG